MAVITNIEKMFKVFGGVSPALTCGAVTVVFFSCALFASQAYFDMPEGVFSIGASVFENAHIHRLLLFPFYHRTPTQLLLNSVTLLFLCGTVEKGYGTVRFLFLFLLLSSVTGFLYSALDLLQDVTMKTPTEGLLPVTLACVALATLHSKMTTAVLCGVSFPTLALPWIVLIICTVLIPNSVMLCNVVAILIGWAYGRGWFSPVDMSEARAALLEKSGLFRVSRSFCGAMFIPSSTEDRRKTLLPQINPTPGSYPVQAYAPLSNSTGSTAATYEGWPDLTGFPPPVNVQGQSSGHSHGHVLGQNHGHSHRHVSGQNHGHSHGHVSGQNHGHSSEHSCNHSH